MQSIHLSSGAAPTLSPTETAFHMKFESVSTTPFGSPLDPEV